MVPQVIASHILNTADMEHYREQKRRTNEGTHRKDQYGPQQGPALKQGQKIDLGLQSCKLLVSMS